MKIRLTRAYIKAHTHKHHNRIAVPKFTLVRNLFSFEYFGHCVCVCVWIASSLYDTNVYLYVSLDHHNELISSLLFPRFRLFYSLFFLGLLLLLLAVPSRTFYWLFIIRHVEMKTHTHTHTFKDSNCYFAFSVQMVLDSIRALPVRSWNKTGSIDYPLNSKCR